MSIIYDIVENLTKLQELYHDELKKLDENGYELGDNLDDKRGIIRDLSKVLKQLSSINEEIARKLSISPFINKYKRRHLVILVHGFQGTCND